MTQQMAFESELDIYLRARFTLMVLVTTEEARALQTVKAVCERTQRACLTWDVADGFQMLTEGGNAVPAARDVLPALEQVDKADGNTLFVLKDFHEHWSNTQFKRKLRSIVQRLKFTRKSILVTSPRSKLPEELKDEAVVVEFPPPSATELEAVLQRLTQTPGVKVNLTKLGREKVVQAALGLTAAQAQRVFAKAIVSTGTLDDRDIDLVTQEKKEIIRDSEALEFYAVTETPDDVGRLGVLKEWLRLRERACTQEARDYGLPAPKGIALIGVPGTGKSLTAKMIGGLWRLPLLRLDVGALFGSLVGEAEERTRRALRLAETVAPAILWIDEMEKALAHGGLDSGTSTRVFGTILTWMQEKTAPCFVVGTANAIEHLPPEVLRKGRFDEIFFLDLPTLAERQEIFTVHLRKRKRLPQDFDSFDWLASLKAMLVLRSSKRSSTPCTLASTPDANSPPTISPPHCGARCHCPSPSARPLARYATGCAKGGRSRRRSRRFGRRNSSSCRCNLTWVGELYGSAVVMRIAAITSLSHLEGDVDGHIYANITEAGS